MTDDSGKESDHLSEKKTEQKKELRTKCGCPHLGSTGRKLHQSRKERLTLLLIKGDCLH